MLNRLIFLGFCSFIQVRTLVTLLKSFGFRDFNFEIRDFSFIIRDFGFIIWDFGFIIWDLLMKHPNNMFNNYRKTLFSGVAIKNFLYVLDSRILSDDDTLFSMVCPRTPCTKRSLMSLRPQHQSTDGAVLSLPLRTCRIK